MSKLQKPQLPNPMWKFSAQTSNTLSLDGADALKRAAYANGTHKPEAPLSRAELTYIECPKCPARLIDLPETRATDDDKQVRRVTCMRCRYRGWRLA